MTEFPTLSYISTRDHISEACKRADTCQATPDHKSQIGFLPNNRRTANYVFTLWTLIDKNVHSHHDPKQDYEIASINCRRYTFNFDSVIK